MSTDQESIPKQLAKLVSRVFSDEYLNMHRDMRSRIGRDRKGYVPISYVATIDIIQQFVDGLQLQNPSSNMQILLKSIEQNCRQLILHDGRIRRICPFDLGKFKTVKPICIEGMKEGTSIYEVRQYLGNSAFWYTEKRRTDAVEVVTVYAPEYRTVTAKLSSKLPFQIISYQHLCKERDYQSRYWEKQQKQYYTQLRHQHKKNHFQTPQQEHDARIKRATDNTMTQEHYDNQKVQFDCVLRMANPEINYLLLSMVYKNTTA